MKLKKVLSGFVSAAILATSTAFVMPLSVSAADTEVLTTGSLGSATLEKNQWSSDENAIANPTITLDNKWGSAKAVSGYDSVEIEYTCEAVDDIAHIYLVAQSGTMPDGWFQQTATPEATGKITLDLSSVQDKTYEAIVVTIEPASSYGIGDTFDPKFTVTSAKLIGSSVPDFEGTILKLNRNPENTEEAQTNWQGYENISGITGSTLADVIADYPEIDVSFTVNGATSGTNKDFDVSKISYQINVNCGINDALYWPWIVAGTSEFDPATKKVTISANLKEAIEAKMTADSKDAADVDFFAVKLVAMTDTANASDIVKLYHSDIKATVKAVPVTSVTLNKTELALKVGDDPAALTATVAPDNATNKTVTWATSNNKVATVDETGKVTAVASGTAEITATAGEKSAECTVTVTNPATAIAIDETASVLVGAEKTLAVTTTPANADELTYTWTSSKPEVATVTNGVVKGVAEGETVITVAAGKLTAQCTVNVTAKAVPATKVTLDKDTLELEVDGTATLTAAVEPKDTTDETKWTSDNTDVATVADGKVTAVGEGTATITVTVGSQTATCKVTVTKPAEPEKPTTPTNTKAYTLKMEDASGWGNPEIKQAAQINVPITLDGFTAGKTTYGDIKDKIVKLEGLGFGSCSVTGVTAEDVSVTIYLQMGANWEHWCATSGNTLADSSVEYDLSTIEDVKDTDVLQAIGFQFNINGNVAGINDLPSTTKVTLNAAEPKASVAGEEEPAEKSDYETGKVETVNDYVPAKTEDGKRTELAVMSITETEAARAESYTVTVKTSDGKEKQFTTNDCYKGFKYNTASGEKTEEAAKGFFIIVKVTGVPDGVTVTVTIEPTK